MGLSTLIRPLKPNSFLNNIHFDMPRSVFLGPKKDSCWDQRLVYVNAILGNFCLTTKRIWEEKPCSSKLVHHYICCTLSLILLFPEFDTVNCTCIENQVCRGLNIYISHASIERENATVCIGNQDMNQP